MPPDTSDPKCSPSAPARPLLDRIQPVVQESRGDTADCPAGSTAEGAVAEASPRSGPQVLRSGGSRRRSGGWC